MNDVRRGTPTRCLLTWVASTAGAAGVVAGVASGLEPPARSAPFDAWLTWLCAFVVVLCAAWGWLVTSVVVLEALSGRARRSPAGPSWLRRLVLSACGVAVIGAATPAMADPALEPDRRERSSLLQGLPLPERAEGRSVSDVVGRAIGASPRPEPTRHHRVAPGDSLWSIAEAQLRAAHAPAGPADVAAYWPRIHAASREAVGPDPDLLLPGQLLRLPALLDIPIPREDHR